MALVGQNEDQCSLGQHREVEISSQTEQRRDVYMGGHGINNDMLTMTGVDTCMACLG